MCIYVSVSVCVCMCAHVCVCMCMQPHMDVHEDRKQWSPSGALPQVPYPSLGRQGSPKLVLASSARPSSSELQVSPCLHLPKCWDHKYGWLCPGFLCGSEVQTKILILQSKHLSEWVVFPAHKKKFLMLFFFSLYFRIIFPPPSFCSLDYREGQVHLHWSLHLRNIEHLCS